VGEALTDFKLESMRHLKTITLAALALAVSLATSTGALSLNFNGMSGTSLQFNGIGSSFQLNPTAGSPATPQFSITSVTGGLGDAVGLVGWVDSGPWAYGPITVSGLVQTANVTGGGVLHISDGIGGEMTGTVDWIQLLTIYSIGGVNAQLGINIHGLSYSGNNQDLNDLVVNGDGAMNLSFQFNPGKTLTQLTTGTGPYRTSFSGSIAPGELAAVPESSTIIAGALLLLPFGASTIRFFRKNRRA
jgi:hypothetical protein